MWYIITVGNEAYTKLEIMKASKMNPSISRRNVVDEMVKPELLIHDAIGEIENLGADERLTNAQIKLQEGMDLLSDFIDECISQ